MSDGDPAAGVLVEQVPVPTWENDLLLDRTEQHGLLVLPLAVRDGVGEYRESDVPMVKALREAGVYINWAHPAGERTLVSQYGAEVAVPISLFVAEALAEESVVQVARWLLLRVRQVLGTRRPSIKEPTFVVEVDRLKIDGDRREIEKLRITGRDERIVDAVASLLRGDSPRK